MAVYALIAAALAFILLLLGGVLFRRKRRFFGSLTTTTGLAIFPAAVVFFLVMLNINTYQRLTHEIPLATISVLSKEQDIYKVEYEEADSGKKEIYSLEGDEWQMDARFLKWRGWATLLGRDPLVRPERLSGRYSAIEQARSYPPTIHSLVRGSAIDLWELAKKYRQMKRWVDAYYGSAVYMPLTPGAVYQVNATMSGLIVRPANKAAQESISAWK